MVRDLSVNLQTTACMRVAFLEMYQNNIILVGKLFLIYRPIKSQSLLYLPSNLKKKLRTKTPTVNLTKNYFAALKPAQKQFQKLWKSEHLSF